MKQALLIMFQMILTKYFIIYDLNFYNFIIYHPTNFDNSLLIRVLTLPFYVRKLSNQNFCFRFNSYSVTSNLIVSLQLV